MHNLNNLSIFNINAFSVENNNPDIPTPEQSNIYNAFNRVRAVAGFRGIITSMSFHNGFWEIDIAKGSKTKTYSFNAVSFKKKFKEEKKSVLPLPGKNELQRNSHK